MLTGEKFGYNTRCRLYKIQGFFVHNNPLRQKPKGVRAGSVELQDRVTFNKKKTLNLDKTTSVLVLIYESNYLMLLAIKGGP